MSKVSTTQTTSGILKKRKFHQALNDGQKSANHFNCLHPGCEKVFTRKSRLQAHMHIHNGTQPFKCPHPGCGKAFSEKQNLKIHSVIHSDKRPFPCPLKCGKSFRFKGNMLDHQRRHFGDRPFKCDICSQCFYRHNVLKAHKVKCKRKAELSTVNLGNEGKTMPAAESERN